MLNENECQKLDDFRKRPLDSLVHGGRPAPAVVARPASTAPAEDRGDPLAPVVVAREGAPLSTSMSTCVSMSPL
jgi:hypothetical protein